jgi:hypothetical protein
VGIIEDMSIHEPQSIAIIGAGIAGAACGHALRPAGHSVHVFDKSRGPGGRLATRRVEWVDRQGQAHTTRLDHGAVGITARSAAFRACVDRAEQEGGLAEWAPRLAAGSLPLECGDRVHVPVPDMPALCRRLLDGASSTWSFAVDRLQRGSSGWSVHAAGAQHPALFDAVLLALPPAQAASLLGPHRGDWARHASIVPMQPCWTLMGIADAPEPAAAPAPGWDLARPRTGPLAWVVRNDTRPGRARVPGQAHWVVHARSGWSRRHLEQPAAWVQAQLQAALSDWLGQAVDWQHCTVHRWRYALPPSPAVASAAPCWWDGALGLGVCGDFLGGRGVEGAWLSAQALCAAVARQASGAAVAPSPRTGPGAAQPIAA